MYLTAQAIYDTATEVSQTSKCFQEERLNLLYNKDCLNDAMESILDMLGSTNNLIVALGSKSIKYNVEDLQLALSIAEEQSKKKKQDYDTVVEDFLEQRATIILKYGSSKAWLAMPIIGVLLYILILEVFHFERVLVVVPMMMILFLMTDIIIHELRLTKAWEEYKIVLLSVYLIETLIHRQA